MRRRPPRSTLFPYTTLCRSLREPDAVHEVADGALAAPQQVEDPPTGRLGQRRVRAHAAHITARRSEEHTSELQSRQYLVCRLLLEKNRAEATGQAGKPAHLH